MQAAINHTLRWLARFAKNVIILARKRLQIYPLWLSKLALEGNRPVNSFDGKARIDLPSIWTEIGRVLTTQDTNLFQEDSHD